jgi:hypothetical protein
MGTQRESTTRSPPLCRSGGRRSGRDFAVADRRVARSAWGGRSRRGLRGRAGPVGRPANLGDASSSLRSTSDGPAHFQADGAHVGHGVAVPNDAGVRPVVESRDFRY